MNETNIDFGWENILQAIFENKFNQTAAFKIQTCTTRPFVFEELMESLTRSNIFIFLVLHKKQSWRKNSWRFLQDFFHDMEYERPKFVSRHEQKKFSRTLILNRVLQFEWNQYWFRANNLCKQIQSDCYFEDQDPNLYDRTVCFWGINASTYKK